MAPGVPERATHRPPTSPRTPGAAPLLVEAVAGLPGAVQSRGVEGRRTRRRTARHRLLAAVAAGGPRRARHRAQDARRPGAGVHLSGVRWPHPGVRPPVRRTAQVVAPPDVGTRRAVPGSGPAGRRRAVVQRGLTALEASQPCSAPSKVTFALFMTCSTASRY